MTIFGRIYCLKIIQTCVTPASTKASIWCNNMGLLANSTRGFGLLNVKGLKRVPYPPTRIKARISPSFLSVPHIIEIILTGYEKLLSLLNYFKYNFYVLSYVTYTLKVLVTVNSCTNST